MLIVRSLSSIPSLSCAVTIGNFDGLHLGHQKLISSVKNFGECAVITFSNHPLTFFSPQNLFTIYPLEQKISLFEEAGVDLLILLPFNKELAELPFDTFLKLLKSRLHFSHLILGEDAKLGAGRLGDREHVQALQEELKFQSMYLPAILHEKTRISSRAIRSAILEGNFAKASALLGRPYSLKLFIQNQKASLDGLAFPTAKRSYPVTLISKDKTIASAASYEHGHLTVSTVDIYGPVETIFTT